jgi:hypothetical protein
MFGLIVILERPLEKLEKTQSKREGEILRKKERKKERKRKI